MPPQKRSIRDFFVPATKGPPPSKSSTAPAPKIAPILREHTPTDPREPRNNAPAGATYSPLPPPSPSAISHDTLQICANRTASTENRPPTTSQSSVNSGTSKRVVSNGEEVVLNSDSETDSLPDLDWGETPSKTKSSAQAAIARYKEEAKMNGLRRPPKKRKDEESFSLFLRAAQKDAEAERFIAEAKANLEKPLVDDETPADVEISEEALANVVRDDADPDKAKRLYLAMQRTSALHMEYTFHLFGGTREKLPISQSFPIGCLPNHGWTSVFEASSTRDTAFLTGFAQRVFRYQQLPEELASWVLDQVCTGRCDVLTDKYIDFLDVHHQHLQSLLDNSRLDSIFSALGADLQRIDPLKQLSPSSEHRLEAERQLPTGLKWVCRLLQIAAPRLHTEAGTHALYVLLHLCMDQEVTSDFDTLQRVQGAIEAITCNTSDNRKLASTLNILIQSLLKRVRHPTLQQTLVSNLPTQSPLTAYFQRYLALAFFLYPTSVDTPLDSPEIPPLIHAHLRDSHDFHVTRSTDYTVLAARLALLDTALGPGPLTVPYEPLTSPSATQESSSPITAPTPLSSEKLAFNKEVDALVQQIKVLSNSIHEATALTDLTRLDAKNRCERLYYRLEHAVRIGGKKLDNIFGNDDDDEGSRRFMSTWMGNGIRSRSDTPSMNGTVSITDGGKSTSDIKGN